MRDESPYEIVERAVRGPQPPVALVHRCRDDDARMVGVCIPEPTPADIAFAVSRSAALVGAVTRLMQVSTDAQRRPLARTLSREAVARELATVRVAGARRSGHSAAAAALLRAAPDPARVLLCVASPAEATLWRSRFIRTGCCPKLVILHPPWNDRELRLRDADLGLVVVDGTRRLTVDQLDALYAPQFIAAFARAEVFHYVLLG